MKVYLGIVLLAFAFQSSIAAKVVCYYGSWAVYNDGGEDVQPEDIDVNICTHVNYAFVSLNIDGTLSAEDDWVDIDQGGFKRTTDLKKRNPNVKVILSIGPSDNYADAAADPERRANMIKSAREFVETYNFDGIDVDWEVPQIEDKENFIALLQEFRDDFDKNGWIVSAAVSAIPQEGYDVPEVSRLLDYINLMTYDMYGPDWSEYTGQNSPLYASSIESDWERDNLNMEVSVQHWIEAGADPQKICAGVAFYGRTYTLADPNNNWLHAPITGAGNAGPIINTRGEMSYVETCLTKWDCTWDDEQKNPVCVNGDQWLGTDNVHSIREKAKFIKSKGLGGVMIWSVDQDDVHGSCGEAKPLLNVLHNTLNS